MRARRVSLSPGARAVTTAAPERVAPDGPAYRWTSVVGAGLGAYLWRRSRKLSNVEGWRLHTARVQRRQLRWLLEHASDTEFGRNAGFARLSELDDRALVEAYRKAVPVRDWYASKDMIARMREGGERDVLWPGLVRFFAQTSGTTAGDKFIPVSDEMLRSNFRASPCRAISFQ